MSFKLCIVAMKQDSLYVCRGPRRMADSQILWPNIPSSFPIKHLLRVPCHLWGGATPAHHGPVWCNWHERLVGPSISAVICRRESRVLSAKLVAKPIYHSNHRRTSKASIPKAYMSECTVNKLSTSASSSGINSGAIYGKLPAISLVEYRGSPNILARPKSLKHALRCSSISTLFC